MASWLDPWCSPFRRLRGRARAIAWSPDGRHLAFTRPPSRQEGFAAAQWVFCVEVDSGREVFAVDTGAEALDVAFSAEDALCVVRRAPAGAVAVVRYAVPDGGVVAQRTLQGFHHEPVRLSAGGGALLVARERYVAIGVRGLAFVLGPTLETRAMLHPYRLPEGARHAYRSSLALRDDGEEVAILRQPSASGTAGCVVHVAARTGRTVTLHDAIGYAAPVARWLGPRALLVSAPAPGEALLYDLPEGAVRHRLRVAPGASPDVGLAVDVHPDRERVLLWGGDAPVCAFAVADGALETPSQRPVREGERVAAAWLGEGTAWARLVSHPTRQAKLIAREALHGVDREVCEVTLHGADPDAAPRLERVPGGRYLALRWREVGAERVAVARLTRVTQQAPGEPRRPGR